MKRQDDEEGSNQRERQYCSQFIIKVHTIRLNVKFPCNMILKYHSQPISPQVIKSQQNDFNFEQQIALKGILNEGKFDIGVFLITQKRENSMIKSNMEGQSIGTTNSILAGQIRLEQQKMVLYEGKSLNVNLMNCLDNSASCNLTILKVRVSQNQEISERNSVRKINQRQQYNNTDQNQIKPSKLNYLIPKEISQKWNQGFSSFEKIEQRVSSQQNVQLRKSYSGSYLEQSTEEYQSRERLGRRVESSYSLKLSMTPSAAKEQYFDKNADNKYRLSPQQRIEHIRSSSNQRRIQLALQRSQQRREIEVDRLKSKNNELQITLQLKDKQITEQKCKIKKLEEQMSQCSYYEQELNFKTTKILSKQALIKTLKQQNQSLKEHILQLQRQLSKEKQSHQTHYNNLKSDSQIYKQSYIKELKTKNHQIDQLQFKLQLQNTQSSNMKTIIQQLQEQLHQKTFQAQREIRLVKEQVNRKNHQLNSLIKGLSYPLNSERRTKTQSQNQEDNSCLDLENDKFQLKRSIKQLKQQNEYLKQKLSYANNKIIYLKNYNHYPNSSKIKASKLLQKKDIIKEVEQISQNNQNEQKWKELIKEMRENITVLEKQLQPLKINQSGKHSLYRKTVELKDYMIRQLEQNHKIKSVEMNLNINGELISKLESQVYALKEDNGKLIQKHLQIQNQFRTQMDVIRKTKKDLQIKLKEWERVLNQERQQKEQLVKKSNEEEQKVKQLQLQLIQQKQKIDQLKKHYMQKNQISSKLTYCSNVQSPKSNQYLNNKITNYYKTDHTTTSPILNKPISESKSIVSIIAEYKELNQTQKPISPKTTPSIGNFNKKDTNTINKNQKSPKTILNPS